MEEKSKIGLLKSEKYKEFSKLIGKNGYMSAYQKWYSQSQQVVKQLLPDRFSEFKNLYQLEKRNSKDFNLITYCISDYFTGLKLSNKPVQDSISACASKIKLQNEILNSCLEIIDSKLSDIIGILQYELYEDELDTAKDIFKKKHYRVAGAYQELL